MFDEYSSTPKAGDACCGIGQIDIRSVATVQLKPLAGSAQVESIIRIRTREAQNLDIPEMLDLGGAALFDADLMAIDAEGDGVVVTALFGGIVDIGITPATIDDDVVAAARINPCHRHPQAR